jgi:16S rRNA (guanine966-N2)-methyltransferase
MLREAVFNICQNEVPNARFLDLFAGSGAMALEALSRGALHATLVEQNRSALSCIRENIATLHLESQTTLLPLDAARALALLTQQKALFDLIYLDPPYGQSQIANGKLQNGKPAFDLEPLIPLLASNATVFIEERYDPHKKHVVPAHPRLQHRDTRRFGIALLSTFHYT